MNGRPGDGVQPFGRHIFHGVTENNECITMLEASGRFGGVAFNSQSASESIAVTANYMLVGSRHFDDGQSVRRISFSSSMVEHVLRLWARSDYKDIRYKKAGSTGYEAPILQKQVASYVDLIRRIRFRAFRPRVPTTTIEPMSSIKIDFLDFVTPRHAVGFLHEFRNFLTLVCGDVIDLWDVQLLHRIENCCYQSDLYFADAVKRPTKSDNFPTLPLLDICHDRELFCRIIAGWLAEPRSRRIGRAAFASIVQDEGFLRLSHLRELVTIIEMQAGSDGTAPLSKEKSRALRSALSATIKEFAEKDADSQSWFETMNKRINNINYHDAKLVLKMVIEQLPSNFISVPITFHSDVIELRNALVHDMSCLDNSDFNKLAFFVANLKAIYAVNDAVALGAKASEIRAGSSFLHLAEHMPLNVFDGDPAEDSDAEC